MAQQLGYVMAAVLSLTATAASAGSGWLISNDYFGDNKDRWRSHAHSVSVTYGRDWDGKLPANFGEQIEVRLAGEFIAPSHLDRPGREDRPYGGYLSAGVHTHFERATIQYSLGVDAALTGEKSGVHKVHSSLHKVFRGKQPHENLDHVDDAVHWSFSLEAGREFALGGAQIRPFTKVRVGIEDYARAGVDLTFGADRTGQFLVRDNPTGHHYRVANSGELAGVSVLVGGDVTKVFDSHLLPENRGYAFEPIRHRLRVGLALEPDNVSIFAGLTYLSEEFHGQHESQRVGSFNVSLNF